ncbi:TIGR02679 domain-containing protein [Lachnospiraceae bacterium 54-53]
MENLKRDELLLQAAEYFGRPEFGRLFDGLRERYGSLSRLGGKVCLKALTKEEADALEGFLQFKVSEGGGLSVSIRQIRRALENTRYGQLGLEDILPLVLEEEMVSNKEARLRKEKEMKEFLDSLSAQFRGTPAGSWIARSLFKGNSLNTLITKDYHSDYKWLTENMPLILCAVNQLPAFTGTHLRLPVFAASVTGNPHYFDDGKKSLKYLLYGIRHFTGGDGSEGNTAEARTELLYRGGILKDDLSNWVLCFGIRGYVSDKELHMGMEEYLKRGEPQILTLQNLSVLKSVTAAGRKVCVVENPSVFARLSERNRESCACICSGGQLRISVLVLLDMLVKNGITVYYSGDFDPEGLCIAQKLVSRYGSRLELWGYHEEIYHKAISSETISERRLNQLDGLTDERLVALGRLLKKYKRPGYQENVMEYYDI